MAAPRYRAAPPATLRIVPLDALTLIFHRRSGITHLVDAPVPAILETLGQEPLSAEALMTRLAADYDLIDGDAGALAARLDELVAAGLVERQCGM